MKTKSFSLALLTTLISVSSFAQKKYDIKFNLKPKEQYDISTTMKSTINQMGMDIHMDMVGKTVYDIEKSGENTAVNMHYKHLDVNVDAMGKDIKLSSDSSNKESETLKKITQLQFQAILDKKGNIVKIIGADSLKAMMGSAGQYFNSESIKKLFEQSFQIYPDGPVAVGDTWKKTLNVKNGIDLTANTIYTLEKVEGTTAFVKITGTIGSNGLQKFETNGMTLEMSLDGTQSGELQINTKTGMFDSSNIIQDLSGKINAMGQEIPMKINTNATLSSTKVK
ncbi:DUF6263 family protein [Rhizosphaericola mali]|uniref:DUF4251 domain-containing protein n=1 Tax=Rhizosphaericola mali TaxID=2545455 RepID=A0A5P2G3E9_9BACT|nr:DUF6263 family protein [Rhizosphaericola mali]QES89727.1 hypothetical protein E0W69_014010 [Rhizosphaericola mali]